MAIMLPQSGIPWIDPCGDPYAGAEMYVYLATTTTPKTVYRDAAMSLPHDHPVVANGSGMFPAVFISGADYRLRIEDADGVVIWDVDGLSVPTTGDSGGGGGDTPVELLARTGDYKDRHDTGTHSGWVRANGRTIGSASSGGTERANADCEDLFVHLWTVDATLTVSGGRGANAASDWASNKTIALPDMRQRARIGMTSMGSSAATLIALTAFDNYPTEGGDDLGATIGTGTVTLTTAQMPSHNHPGSATSTDGAHSHTYYATPTGGGVTFGNGSTGAETGTTSTSGAHNHDVTVASQGGGQAHSNMQPSAVVTVYIKL